MSWSRPSPSQPWLARRSRRAFARWAARQTGADKFARFGENSLVCPPVMIRGHERVAIADDVVIHPGAIISVVVEDGGKRYEPSLTIGRGARIGCDLVVACCGEIHIGEDALLSDRVFIGDTYHSYRDPEAPILHQGIEDPRPVHIGDGSFIGVNAAVLPGVTIGEGAYVGANAVVTRDVPARAVVGGNPAQVITRWNGQSWTGTQKSP